MNSVLQTTDYDMFKVRDWNRNISASNMKKIDASVKAQGWLKHPIMVNEKMEVADGQHRLEYAKQHSLPVYYVVVPGLSVNDCVVMNNARTSWTLIDYIKLFANQGKESYIMLQELLHRYPFVPTTILIAVVKNSAIGGQGTKGIKSGALVLTQKEYNNSLKKLAFLEECQKYILSISGRVSATMLAVAFAFDCPGVRKDRLLRQLKTYFGIATAPANLDSALQEIEKIYNYRNSKEEYVYIYTEYKKHAAEKMLRGTEALRDKNRKR